MNDFVIYTDGSYRSSLNQGGIGIVWLKNGKKVFEYSKGFKGETNNTMELKAIYIALKSIKKPIKSLEICSDSEYSIGVLTKDWNPKKNVELIGKIKQQIKYTQNNVKEPIKWTHVDGHQKDDSEHTKWNNYVDKLCTEASKMIL